MNNPLTCKHGAFMTTANIARLTENGQEDEEANNFSVDLRITCTECNTPFRWLGLNMGWSPIEPMTNVDGLELRAPIAPGASEIPISGRMSFTMPERKKGN